METNAALMLWLTLYCTNGVLLCMITIFITLCFLCRFIVKGTRKAKNTQNHLLGRLLALEARATKRATPSVMVYLPVIFFAYGILLGT